MFSIYLINHNFDNHDDNNGYNNNEDNVHYENRIFLYKETTEKIFRNVFKKIGIFDCLKTAFNKLTSWVTSNLQTITKNVFLKKSSLSLHERCLNAEYFWSVFSPNTWKYGPEKTPQGYDQKCKLFRTNSFVLAHSSAQISFDSTLFMLRVTGTFVTLINYRSFVFLHCCYFCPVAVV